MQGVWAINNPDELPVVIALSCENQIQIPYAPKFKSSDVTSGVSFISNSR